LPSAVVVASAVAFAAALLLLSPFAMGMFEVVFTFTPKLFSKLKSCRTLAAVYSISSTLSVGSEAISVIITPGSSVNLTSALVHKSTPNAAPFPSAIAFTIVAAP